VNDIDAVCTLIYRVALAIVRLFFGVLAIAALIAVLAGCFDLMSPPGVP